MGIKERRERDKERLRALILDTAREMFSKEGYEAVTMRRIADAIEYSPTALYLHFADKESLIRELCAADFLKFAEGLGKVMATNDPVERLRRIGRAYVRFAMEHPNSYRLLFMTRTPDGVAEGERPIEQGNPEQDAYAFVQAAVRTCIEAGAFRPEDSDADLVAQVLWASLHGVVSLHITMEHDPWIPWATVERTTERTMSLLLDGLVRPGWRPPAGAPAVSPRGSGARRQPRRG